MRVAFRTAHFHSTHAVCRIAVLFDRPLAQGLVKAWPTRPRLKLGFRTEQGLSAANAGVGAGIFGLVVLAGKRRLSAGFTGNIELFRCKLFFPFVVGSLNFICHIRSPQLLATPSAYFKAQPKYAGAQQLDFKMAGNVASPASCLGWFLADRSVDAVFLDFALYSPTMGRMAITKRQRQVYDYIAEFVQRNQYSPSFEEIGEGLGLTSLATVHKHISNLEKKGLLSRDYNRSRSIDLLPPKGRLKQSMSVNSGTMVPLMGRIAAGQPIEAIERAETISLADFTRSKEVFALEVRGESMQDEHILDGDYVLVEKTKVAHNGDIVVALVEGSDATLKRLYREGENTRLQPSNAKMKPIIVPSKDVAVQGRVIGVLRKY